MARLKHESGFLDLEETNATITEVYPKLCRVRLDSDGRILLCSYRRAQVYNREEQQERSPVAVVDRAKVQILGSQDGVVEGVAERRNSLMRVAPGREGIQVHVLASNVDLLVIVAATKNPEFLPGLVDRFLVASQFSGIPAVLCLNKIDLVEGGSGPWELYRKLGVPVIEVSAHSKKGLEELIARVRTGVSVFCGHSGVGKTSLLRGLLGQDVGRVGELNAVTQKGKHTTTGAVMLEGSGLRVIDTPGVREFGLPGLDPENLKDFFPEFSELVCATRFCSHDGEEGCQAASFPRHESYVRILESIREEQVLRKASERKGSGKGFGKNSKPDKNSKPGRRFPSR